MPTPAIEELELRAVLARTRPGTPASLPLIGPGSAEELLLATGHHRGRVLLSGITADAVRHWSAATGWRTCWAPATLGACRRPSERRTREVA